jgi:hypothetical protein
MMSEATAHDEIGPALPCARDVIAKAARVEALARMAGDIAQSGGAANVRRALIQLDEARAVLGPVMG